MREPAGPTHHGGPHPDLLSRTAGVHPPGTLPRGRLPFCESEGLLGSEFRVTTCNSQCLGDTAPVGIAGCREIWGLIRFLLLCEQTFPHPGSTGMLRGGFSVSHEKQGIDQPRPAVVPRALLGDGARPGPDSLDFVLSLIGLVTLRSHPPS